MALIERHQPAILVLRLVALVDRYMMAASRKLKVIVKYDLCPNNTDVTAAKTLSPRS